MQVPATFSPYKFLQNHNKTAVFSETQNLTFSQLLCAAHELSKKLDVQPGHRVVLYAENSLEWLIAFYAAWIRQAIVVPVDFQSSAGDLQYIIDDCTPTAIFYTKETAPAVQKALDNTQNRLQELILARPEITQKDCPELTVVDIEKTALLIYTSGTTGSPKGVMLSCENLIMNIWSVSEGVPIYGPDERTMILLPLHHIFPLLGSLVAPLATGGSVAIAPAMTGEAIMKTLQDHAITIIIGVPRLYDMISKGIMDKINASAVAKMLFNLARRINSKGLSSTLFKSVHKKFGGAVKNLVSGGAALDPKVGSVFQTLGFDVLEGFGMTEAAPMITFTRPGDVKIGSTGKAVPGVDIEIRDGEICARGRNIMQGYYHRPEETAEVLKDGWLYTGDLGKIDEKGYLWITGRKKEIIVLPNGKNINPANIELQLLHLDPNLEEAGVFQQSGILQVLLYYGKKGGNTSPEKQAEELLKQYNAESSPYKRILKYHITPQELPKTRLGKLRRFQLPELVEAPKAKAEKSKEPEYKEYVLLRQYLEK